MKRKVLALLFGGVIAIGSLCMSSPITARADEDPFEATGRDTWEAGLNNSGGWDCKGRTTDKHITSSTITAGNGTITVTVEPVYSDNDKCKECVIGIINEKQNAVGGAVGDYYYSPVLMSGNVDKPAKWSQFLDNSTKTVTFNGLPNGTTYYVYAIINDTHGGEYSEHKVHYAKYLGSVTPGTGSSTSSASGSSSSGGGESVWSSYEGKVNSQIAAAQSGSTVVLEKGISAVSNSMMKELLAKGDVSLKLEFTYKDQEYVIIIPAGAALDNDIPWYGPLYLAQQFGNRAGMESEAAASDTAVPVTQETAAENAQSGTYEVRSGDTLSKIAAANNMTLTDLIAKNPQIKDPGKIRVGQQINL